MVDPVTDTAMAPRGHHSVLLLPLVLLATGLAQLSEGASYSQFLNQRIDLPKSSASTDQNSCELMMQCRGLTRPFCITSNTFIQAPTNQVQGVCSSGRKRIRDNVYNSIARFHVATCQLTSIAPLGLCTRLESGPAGSV
ncbi:2-oxoglutarate and iron-dependent oxygenase domain-containing protein 3 [Platysternon megacephalum]|uniref:2-oxoglutarate and iron-dependent oxygenase domain-containing protein 3 n=1 Tax=Platysternon megacephalum TaxID=55544 RepID=A0A4D9DQ40_9SAUR|nr:2-oxoglutarate and iron-dependent oxygenase domain-containing protein 3 [Platysternon megacephalum]